jgi:hypothetical protein
LIINSIYIALIPKIKNPSRVTDYQPLNLCNLFYKLSGKVLVNRMKKVLSHIISPNQGSFIPNNILMAFEALHTMNG